MTVAYKWSGRV